MSLKPTLFAFVAILFFTSLSAQSSKTKPDAVLQKKLAQLTDGFQGTVGIYVRNLKTGQTASLHADSVFPTASMVKIPILIGMMDKIDKGELHYHDHLIYKDSLLYAGEDILGSFKDSSVVDLSKVMMLMITTSDNTASLWCQSLAGTGTTINKILENNGLKYTRVNSRTPGREAARKQYGWGQTTPHELAELLVHIREGKMINAAASERMYRYLTRIYWDEEALSEIPPHIQVASKQGAVDASRSEVVLVNAPSGDYVFCVITKNQQDTSWQYTNAGYVLLRNVSRLLWNYFEPHSDWKPAEGLKKYYTEK